MDGNTNEIIAIGMVIKIGYPYSRIDVINAKYDAIID